MGCLYKLRDTWQNDDLYEAKAAPWWELKWLNVALYVYQISAGIVPIFGANTNTCCINDNAEAQKAKTHISMNAVPIFGANTRTCMYNKNAQLCKRKEQRHLHEGENGECVPTQCSAHLLLEAHLHDRLVCVPASALEWQRLDHMWRSPSTRTIGLHTHGTCLQMTPTRDAYACTIHACTWRLHEPPTGDAYTHTTRAYK